MMDAVPAGKLFDVEESTSRYNVIGIDEGQFFPDLIEFCEKMAGDGKIVVVAALDGTFQRKPFGRVLELIPLAEEVTKLNAVCMMCFQDAPFSRRIGSETEVEVIGGADKVCHYVKDVFVFDLLFVCSFDVCYSKFMRFFFFF